MRRLVTLLVAGLLLAACESSNVTGTRGGIEPPTNLYYQLMPSGDPTNPEGILLRWDPVDDPGVTNYVVYSRGSSSGQWSRRAETTSASARSPSVAVPPSSGTTGHRCSVSTEYGWPEPAGRWRIIG